MEPGLRCPHCKNLNCDKVIETIKVEEGIRRRHRCTKCDQIFPSFQYVGVKQMIVEKRSGRHPELFKREKVYDGVDIAYTKLGVSKVYVEALTDRICEKVHATAKRSISSEEIGRIVLDTLHNDPIDESKVAYIRFACVFLYVRRREDLIELVSSAQEKVCQPQHNNGIELS